MATLSRLFAAIATIMSAVTLTLNEQSSTGVDLVTSGFEGAEVDVAVTFNTSGSKDAVISVYSGVDTTYTNVPIWSGRIPFVAAGGAGSVTVVIKDVAFFKVTVKSDTGETNHGTCTIRQRCWNWQNA